MYFFFLHCDYLEMQQQRCNSTYWATSVASEKFHVAVMLQILHLLPLFILLQSQLRENSLTANQNKDLPPIKFFQIETLELKSDRIMKKETV